MYGGGGHKFKFLICLSILLFTCTALRAQTVGKKKFLVGLNYAQGFPAGDLDKRYGGHLLVGTSVEWVHPSMRWVFGAEGDYLFGNRVKEDVVSEMRTTGGKLIGSDFFLTHINLKMRGFQIYGTAGYQQFLGGKGHQHYLLMKGGLGWLQHFYRIQDDNRSLSQFTEEFKKGYDRLTAGPSATVGAYYRFFHRNGKVNAQIGGQLYYGSTKSLRSYQYDLGEISKSRRTDINFGLRVGWLFAIYGKGKADEIYY